MTDREKVAEKLFAIKAYFAGQAIEAKEEIIKEVFVEAQQTIENAISMLKEQEPKSVYWRLGRAHCPSCGELFPKKQDKQYIRFCNWCGQAVKWE